jgi:hypothetical protein
LGRWSYGWFDSTRPHAGRDEARLGAARLGWAWQGEGYIKKERFPAVSTFIPKGEKPLWQLVYDHAVRLTPGDLITWADFEQLLGYDPSVAGASRGPIHTASRRLLRDHDRTLTSVRKRGYRVAFANEHEPIARSGQRSATKKLRRSADVAVHVDRNALTPKEASSLDSLAHVLTAQAAMLKRQERRITGVEADVQRQDDRLDVLEATLRKHGIEIPKLRVVDQVGNDVRLAAIDADTPGHGR